MWAGWLTVPWVLALALAFGTIIAGFIFGPTIMIIGSWLTMAGIALLVVCVLFEMVRAAWQREQEDL